MNRHVQADARFGRHSLRLRPGGGAHVASEIDRLLTGTERELFGPFVVRALQAGQRAFQLMRTDLLEDGQDAVGLADALLSRALRALHGALGAYAELVDPESDEEVLVARLSAGLFPRGATLRGTPSERAQRARELVERARTEEVRLVLDRVPGGPKALDVIESRIRELDDALAEVGGAPAPAELRGASEAADLRLAELLAKITAELHGASGDAAERRATLLAPYLREVERQRGYYQRSVDVIDLDPDTGRESSPPAASA